jgi:hypothetical protein
MMEKWEDFVAEMPVQRGKTVWFRTTTPYDRFWPAWWADIQCNPDCLFTGGGSTLLLLIMTLSVYASLAYSVSAKLDAVNGILHSVHKFLDSKTSGK